jgi:hypothetical protein
VATVLYTALTDLKVYSVIATWFAHPQDVLPLDPSKASTIALLAAGSIELAPENAVDTCTPAGIVRGQPGVKAPGTVSN